MKGDGNPSEHQIQVAAVTWFKYQYPDRIICAIPNAGKRTPFQGKWMKEEGLLAGLPDLFIPEAMHGFNGLWLETKTKRGTVKKHQKELIQQLKDRGYLVEIYRKIDEFMDIVNDYFST